MPLLFSLGQSLDEALLPGCPREEHLVWMRIRNSQNIGIVVHFGVVNQHPVHVFGSTHVIAGIDRLNVVLADCLSGIAA